VPEAQQPGGDSCGKIAKGGDRVSVMIETGLQRMPGGCLSCTYRVSGDCKDDSRNDTCHARSGKSPGRKLSLYPNRLGRPKWCPLKEEEE